jgi:hypothetical protein
MEKKIHKGRLDFCLTKPGTRVMWHATVDSHVRWGTKMNRKQELGDESGPFKSSRTKLTQTQELGDEIGYFA